MELINPTKITKKCRDLPLYILKSAIKDQTMQNKNFDKNIRNLNRNALLKSNLHLNLNIDLFTVN